ncbi:hypothetical protein SteCoe_9139 [Stentor coeruleus]|uniref:PPM-type phosphatase domain-containing protein n=1 Tax=Stentor coeruleus TaxID=5963 RepID=A0A1R2CII2_9CILI|nr:hypothetical protein SteCoe_9139 [Stentor coeruleus]
MGNCCGPQLQYLEDLEYKQIVRLNIQEKDREGKCFGKFTLAFSLLPPSDYNCQIFDIENSKLRISGCALPGVDPRGECEKECQDTFIFLSHENTILTVLFDGHGKEGRRVSMFCKDYVTNYFNKNHEVFDTDPRGAIEEMIENCDTGLTTSGIDCNLSGSTVVMVVVNSLGIHAGSVGDSKAILATLPKDNSPVVLPSYKNSTFKRPVRPIRSLNIVPLTADQKPNHEEELKRIRAAGGVVEKLADDLGRPVGPYRVWKKNGNLPGLAMSRSVGDTIAHEIGVISTPITHTFPIYLAFDQFIVLASNGIWDVMENFEVVNFVEKFRGATSNCKSNYPAKTTNSTIARLLCEEARYRWLGVVEEDDVMIDDITCIVIELSYGEIIRRVETGDVKERQVNKFRSIVIENAVKSEMTGAVRKDKTRGSMAADQAVIEEALIELQNEDKKTQE